MSSYLSAIALLHPNGSKNTAATTGNNCRNWSGVVSTLVHLNDCAFIAAQVHGAPLTAPQGFLVAVLATYVFLFLKSIGRFFHAALDVPEFVGNGIRLSSDHICGVGLLNGGFRGQRKWTDVHHIALSAHGAAANPNLCSKRELILSFRSGGCATIDLGRLSSSDLQKLFFAIESRANPLCCSPEVVLLKNRILKGDTNTNADDVTYTEIWEQSLANSFVATNFVPLKAGHVLSKDAAVPIQVLMPISSKSFSAVYLAEAIGGTRVILKEFTLPQRTSEFSSRDEDFDWARSSFHYQGNGPFCRLRSRIHCARICARICAGSKSQAARD